MNALLTRSLAVSWAQALAELGVILRLDSAQAQAMLMEACEREPSHCRRCGGERLYRLGGNRLRCAKCRYSFYPFTGRWFGRHRLPATTWLAAIKGFELRLGAGELARLCDLSVNTASELLRTIQMSLAAADPAWLTTVRACEEGIGVPRRFRVAVTSDALIVTPVDGSIGKIEIEVSGSGGSSDAVRSFQIAARRSSRLPPDRFALKLKELELRLSARGSLLDLALDALRRYIPAGLPEHTRDAAAGLELSGKTGMLSPPSPLRALPAMADRWEKYGSA